MSVFKKLVGFLFEEEEEIEEEGELEEVTLHETYRPKAHSYEEEMVQGKHAPSSQPKSKPLSQPQREEEPLMTQRRRQEKKFTKIDADREVTATTVKRSVQRNEVRSEKRSMKRSEPMKKEFEFTPVISPIFGVDEQTSTRPSDPLPPSVPQMRTTISSTPRTNPLGTILSPMYGATELEVFEEEAKEHLDVADLIEESDYASFMPQEEISYDDDVLEDEELIRVPLEELLGKEETSEPSDDLLQFSLFGDDEMIRTDQSDATYTIKE